MRIGLLPPRKDVEVPSEEGKKEGPVAEEGKSNLVGEQVGEEVQEVGPDDMELDSQ